MAALSQVRLALKVDVDTYDGMRDGVPNLLALFRGLGLRASFFIPFGPDASGQAIFRVFRKKGFLKKMLRTRALKLYGWKAALRGTLLPSPRIGSSFPETVRWVRREGHELGIHGYHHVEWQDRLYALSPRQVQAQIEKGIQAFHSALGERPRAFAAPAWLCSPQSLECLDAAGFDYASDTRGRTPFFPVMGGRTYKTLQVPSTLPTADEVLAWDGVLPEQLNARMTEALAGSALTTHVHSIHTEVEGTALFSSFSSWVRELKRAGVRFCTVGEIAREARQNAARIPAAVVVLDELPGRAGGVACQEAGR